MECLSLANQISTKDHKGWQTLLTDFFTYIDRLTIGEPGK